MSADALRPAVFDCLAIDTTPGANSPYAPPRDWDGGAGAYAALVARRAGLPLHGQQMYSSVRMAQRGQAPTFSGPYAAQAQALHTQLLSEAVAKARALRRVFSEGEETKPARTGLRIPVPG